MAGEVGSSDWETITFIVTVPLRVKVTGETHHVTFAQPTILTDPTNFTAEVVAQAGHNAAAVLAEAFYDKGRRG